MTMEMRLEAIHQSQFSMRRQVSMSWAMTEAAATVASQ